MSKNSRIIGIDVGSIAVSIAKVAADTGILDTRYRFHNGDVEGSLNRLLQDVNWKGIDGVACTGSTSNMLQRVVRYDTRVSVIAAARALHDRIGSILIVGGEKFGLISFDESDDYLNYRSNSSCAAGTGSFLDQQAKRLNLDSIEQFCDIANANRDAFPKIASRCAVFCQDGPDSRPTGGYRLEAICDGLSHGLAKSIVDTLFTGTTPALPLVCVGGVSRNRVVVHHLTELLGVEIAGHKHSSVYGAIGCALCLASDLEVDEVERGASLFTTEGLFRKKADNRLHSYPPLELVLSDYPDFASLKHTEYTADFRFDFRHIQQMDRFVFTGLPGWV